MLLAGHCRDRIYWIGDFHFSVAPANDRGLYRLVAASRGQQRRPVAGARRGVADRIHTFVFRMDLILNQISICL